MRELSNAIRLCQNSGDENGFIRVEFIQKELADKKLKAFAKIESSYTLPTLVVWDNRFENGITYDVGTKSFLFLDGTIAYQHN